MEKALLNFSPAKKLKAVVPALSHGIVLVSIEHTRICMIFKGGGIAQYFIYFNTLLFILLIGPYIV